MTPIRRLLRRFINQGLTSAEEIAVMVGCSSRRVYRIMNGELNFWDHEVMTISQHFSDMGHNEFAKLFLSGKYGVIPIGDLKINGCLQDETAEATKIMGKLLERFEERDKQAGLDLCDDLLRVVKQKKSEFRNLD